MANTYAWKVAQCDRTLADGVISTLHYTVTAVTDDGVYSADAYGSIGLEAPDAETMIAYDSVTEVNCIAWLQAALGGDEKVTEIQTALDNQLTEKRTPTTGAGTPWA
tara:strand:+ start:7962 stop:8282 length:321 start_codon:yes stop_codon:yes gene_type:complete